MIWCTLGSNLSSGPITALTSRKKAIFFLLSVEARPRMPVSSPIHTARHSLLQRVILFLTYMLLPKALLVIVQHAVTAGNLMSSDFSPPVPLKVLVLNWHVHNSKEVWISYSWGYSTDRNHSTYRMWPIPREFLSEFLDVVFVTASFSMNVRLFVYIHLQIGSAWLFGRSNKRRHNGSNQVIN